MNMEVNGTTLALEWKIKMRLENGHYLGILKRLSSAILLLG